MKAPIFINMRDIHQFSGRMGNEMFRHAYLYSQVREGKIPDVYVQDYKYFEKYETEIKELFGEGIGYLPYVAIHLRVGSNPIKPEEPRYMDNPFYYRLVESGFYIDALKHFPDRKFIVFSDDIAFAKTYFEGDKFAFDEGGNDLDVLNRMASCDGHIIGNSSFGWWGAFLSPNRGKVVCPTDEHWFATGGKIGCPLNWIRI